MEDVGGRLQNRVKLPPAYRTKYSNADATLDNSFQDNE
jgi:hypothetical protein